MIKKEYIVENKYINILKYLTFQKFQINNDLYTNIYMLVNKKNNNINSKVENSKNDTLNKLVDIFQDICSKYDIEYIYYILILESINKMYIRNLFRIFNYKYIRIINENVVFNNIKLKNIKLKYKLSDFNKSSKPKFLLIDLLDDIKKKDPNIILFFIICINHFFT